MHHPNDSTESRKNKHLNFQERILIQLRLKDSFSAYKISKELQRPINTIINEIKHGTTTQIKQGQYIQAGTGAYVYKNHGLNSCVIFKHLKCSNFIDYAIDKIKNHSCSPYARVGEALSNGKFEYSEIVCIKTLYSYIDIGLLEIKNADLPIKLRRNTKSNVLKKHKKKLGTSISEHPVDINSRKEFGHCEIYTVLGKNLVMIMYY